MFNKESLYLKDWSNFPIIDEITKDPDKNWKIISFYLDFVVNSMSFSVSSKSFKEELNNSTDYVGKVDCINTNVKRRRVVTNKKDNDELLSKLNYMLLTGKLQAFVDEHGEVKKNHEKFIKYLHEIAKNIYLNDRCESNASVNENFGNYKKQDYMSEISINANEFSSDTEFANNLYEREWKITELQNLKNSTSKKNEYEYNNMDYKCNFNNDNIEYIINNILDGIEQYELLNLFLLYYFVFEDDVKRNSKESPSNMDKIFLQNKIINNKKFKTNMLFQQEYRYDDKEKEKIIKNYLDPFNFWDYFLRKFEEKISKNNYYQIYNYLISHNISYRTKMRKRNEIKKRVIQFLTKMEEDLKRKNNFNARDIFNLLKSRTIPQNLIRINEKNNLKIKENVLKEIEINMPCNHKIFTTDIVFDKETLSLYAKNYLSKNISEIIKKHLKYCTKCLSYYNIIATGVAYRTNRNNSIAYMLRYAYENPETFTEEQYINKDKIFYYKKEFRANPCETNFYYLILSYIENGQKEYAKKLLKEGINLYKENIFAIKTIAYLEKDSDIQKKEAYVKL